MSTQFQDKVAWITGGGTGIGRAVALELAARGADVAVSGRRVEPLEETVAEIEGLGRRGLAVSCDVTDEAAVEAAVARVVEAWGGLDVAVANAGFGVGGAFESITPEQWRWQFEVNVMGVVLTARAALPELRKRQGRLAIVGSVNGAVATPGNSPYVASKFAVRGLGLSLAMELHGSGVSCTTIQPGFVESEIAKVDNQGRHRPEWEDRRPAKLMWPADRAARRVVQAIYRRKREYTFTGHGKLAAFLGRHNPGLVHFAVTRLGGADKARRLRNASDSRSDAEAAE